MSPGARVCARAGRGTVRVYRQRHDEQASLPEGRLGKGLPRLATRGRAGSVHGLTGRSACICELAQQLRQLTALVLRERREYPLLDFVEHVVERSQLLAPGGGDRDDVAAPGVGVDRAFDQSEALELAQPGHDVAAGDARAAPQVRLAGWAPFLARREHAVVVGPQ